MGRAGQGRATNGQGRAQTERAGEGADGQVRPGRRWVGQGISQEGRAEAGRARRVQAATGQDEV